MNVHHDLFLRVCSESASLFAPLSYALNCKKTWQPLVVVVVNDVVVVVVCVFVCFSLQVSLFLFARNINCEVLIG